MTRLFYNSFLFVIIFLSFSSGAGEDFSANPPSIKVIIKEGNFINYPIVIFNTNNRQEFNIEYSSKLDFISIDKRNFILDKDRADDFNVLLRGNHGRGVYVGKITVSGKNNNLRRVIDKKYLYKIW